MVGSDFWVGREWVRVEFQGGSAAERAYLYLRDAILEGRVAKGEMLGEATVAAEIGVSRTPVRAALVRLQEEQWITIYPKRGALVNGLADDAVADLIDARFVLESAAVQRVGVEGLQDLTRRLREQIRDQRRALESEDRRRFIELTTGFHHAFVAASGNSVLVELSERLEDRQRYSLFLLGERLLDRCREIIDEHEQLVEALEDQDPARFTETLRRHINDVHSKPQ
ncbi:GntR family transcriptional regulator [Leucobacter insecticola]|uniref:GntR family transcriptional regulator n=1 Tax=Leucobacter insecticola TaxID=2714934 RepID=UPI0019810BE5|nr:GntR family transcriptional regulator [Leucobacter insecticola]